MYILNMAYEIDVNNAIDIAGALVRPFISNFYT